MDGDVSPGEAVDLFLFFGIRNSAVFKHEVLKVSAMGSIKIQGFDNGAINPSGGIGSLKSTGGEGKQQ